MHRRPVLTLTAAALGVAALTAPSLAQVPPSGGGSGSSAVQVGAGPDGALEPSCDPPAALSFEQGYIDEARAGGEPMVVSHPDGHLLWGSHAGTTHFYSDAATEAGSAAFIENYEGQTYQYVSEDGTDFEFVPRLPVTGGVQVAGLPASGFSDPEFAIDAAGNVFISEINLANVAVSKSTDGGRSYTLQNVAGFTSSDRQWMAADGEDELYMAANGFGGGTFPGEPAGNLGHFIAKSTDGGATWSAATVIDPLVGDIAIDKDRGILYSLHEDDGTLSMAVFDDIREEYDELSHEVFPIASGIGMTGVQRLIDPTFDIDDDGNLYVTWSDNGNGQRAQGIYYSYSTDQGRSWAEPLRVDPDDRDEVWPWIAVGDPGQVAVAYLQGDSRTGATLPGEEGGTDTEWHVDVAVTRGGLGCGEDGDPPFTITRASAEAVHTGTICQHGTTCQTDGTDRRLGDYFSIEVSEEGRVHVAVTDTRQGGAVGLPLHIRQTGDDHLLRGGAFTPVEIGPGAVGRSPAGRGHQPGLLDRRIASVR